MAESSEKDPYMQAYITARMKNQVEDMKLQKLLSTMEVTQRVKKTMINLELFEDRKRAHQLQREAVQVANRQRKATARYLQQKAHSHRRTANWTSSMMTSEHAHTLANSSAASGERAVYPVTRSTADFGSASGARDSFPQLPPASRGPSAQPTKRPRRSAREASHENKGMPSIQVTDCDGDDVPVIAPATPNKGGSQATADKKDSEVFVKAVPRLAFEHASAGVPGTTRAPPPTKTAIIVTPPPLSGSHRASMPHPPSRPATEPFRRTTEGSVSFPPVVRSRSTRTRYARSTLTASTDDKTRRQDSPSHMWPGDPRAICSVRRERRNIDEMLALKKAGEETRRLIREATTPCSRNCNKPDIVSMMEKTYVNLPDLLPEIEKARKRLGKKSEKIAQQDRLLLSSAEKRNHVGRFELEQEQVEGSKQLPVYNIDYGKLREMGGTRRNSVLA